MMTDEAGSDTAAEIAGIQQTMQTDYRTYAGDPGMQARYLELLTARDAAEPGPREPSAVDAEIATIEQRIRTDSGYFGDKEAQARYLTLIQEREAERTAAPAGAVVPRPEVTAESAPQAGGPNVANITNHHVEDMVRNLEAEPATAALLKSWGADAKESVQFAAVEMGNILNAVSPEAARSLFDAAEDLPAADYAKLVRHLSDAGRAKRTR